jgi:diguanylate cyclase (GGDEF)-like protein
MGTMSNICESDKLARYGGDEFVILLTETGRDAAQEAGERIRKAVENTAFDAKGQQLKTTVSTGIASFPDHANSLEDLMSKADEALYHSKESGRNRVTVHENEEIVAESDA